MDLEALLEEMTLPPHREQFTSVIKDEDLPFASVERLGATAMSNENSNLPVIMPSKGAGDDGVNRAIMGNRAIRKAHDN